jgi:hypothetical protein
VRGVVVFPQIQVEILDSLFPYLLESCLEDLVV